VPVVFAHLQVGAAQLTLDDVPPVVEGERTHIGQWYVGQQVIGLVPSRIGVDPSGQATTIAGQRTPLGSQVGLAGTHCPAHVWPEQFPFASHWQLGSLVGQAQGGVGGTEVPPSAAGVGDGVPVPEPPSMPVLPVPVPPVVVPPALQPQPPQLTWQT
jgi:hypothetical protein